MRLEHFLPLPLYLLLWAVYILSAPYFATEKQRAYILSTLSSGVMTTISLPFVGKYLIYGLATTYEEAQRGWMASLANFGVVFFGVYLFADLTVGYLKYRSQVGLLTGWIHHVVYIGLMFYCLNSAQSPIFLTGAVMELPTFDLAISNLFPAVRNDLRFLSGFFAIRILFHLGFLLDTIRPSSRAMMGGTWAPVIMLSLALILHVSWFKGGSMGYIKRQKASRKIKALNDREKSSLPSHRDRLQVPGHDVDTTPELVPTTLSPEDSPLTTPYTPGTTPMTLRDSYIIPTLTLPKLSQLPQFPPLPAAISNMPMFQDFSERVKEMGVGEFRDAVKTRWEENRERFSLGAMGLRGGMTGLRLRNQGPRGGVKGEEEQRGTVSVTVQEALEVSD